VTVIAPLSASIAVTVAGAELLGGLGEGLGLVAAPALGVPVEGRHRQIVIINEL